MEGLFVVFIGGLFETVAHDNGPLRIDSLRCPVTFGAGWYSATARKWKDRGGRRLTPWQNPAHTATGAGLSTDGLTEPGASK